MRGKPSGFEVGIGLEFARVQLGKNAELVGLCNFSANSLNSYPQKKFFLKILSILIEEFRSKTAAIIIFVMEGKLIEFPRYFVLTSDEGQNSREFDVFLSWRR